MAIAAGEQSVGWLPAEPETPFDDLPAEMILRAFGVNYAHVRPPEGGDLYLTRYGWPWVAQLAPAAWYTEKWYATQGQRLAGGTGNVYRVHTRRVAGRSVEAVVKFSRVGQEVPVEMATLPTDLPPEVLANARVNSPMEEFGLVMEMRRSSQGPRTLRLLAQHPLAIYAPPEEFELWQLGRNQSAFWVHRRVLADDQQDRAKAIELDIRRIYVLLYGWVKGRDAEEALDAGQLTESEVGVLTERVARELELKGFRVLDNKPKHFILRTRKRDGELLRRSGELAYALVDFEFLQRTAAYQQTFKLAQRARYWRLLGPRPVREAGDIPTHLRRMTVFGVPYVEGSGPDQGKLWVVGDRPELFDYFLPERWRRTPRVKLSTNSEVYRTRTRDDIHVVYRRSRVGARPQVDPLTEAGKRIRAHGYNSPFEEVAIAERLRPLGVRTVFPRAIFRTGHHTTKALHLRDERRFADHGDLLTPEPAAEPVLTRQHDYYTIWSYFRGVDPVQSTKDGRVQGVLGLREALDLDLVSEPDYDALTARIRAQLRELGFPEDTLDEDELAVVVDEEGAPRRGSGGDLRVTLSVDVVTAYEYGLLDEDTSRKAIARMHELLRAADCEKLDLSGSDLLLAMYPDGRFSLDEAGEPQLTLCNFDLIRGLYRQIR